ncbi:MAG: hypothetical protein KAT16_01925 [Candidatus Heimdallarchaeota archaeon]|nr:hypothetical protein [Candidatus Heimdallarchaeota archaeon]
MSEYILLKRFLLAFSSLIIPYFGSFMPELPELEAISNYLNEKLSGNLINGVQTYRHTVIRNMMSDDVQSILKGAKLQNIVKIGKILQFQFTKANETILLYIDHGLTGRLAWLKKKNPSKTIIAISFSSGRTLIYHDKRLHGSIWLYRSKTNEKLPIPPKLENFGPDILLISELMFIDRIRKFRGEIKGVLTNQQFITGIGNAYADEILFEARIHPFTNRTQLTTTEIKQLYLICQEILTVGSERISEWLFTSDKLNNQRYWRKELFKVHLCEGQPCIRCGKTISAIKANRRITNFCRKCSPSKNKNFI